MFTRQAPPLLQSMYTSGMSPMSASAMQSLLGQCRQPLRHNGPITFDYTSPEMKAITPGVGQFQFAGAQLPQPEVFPRRPREEEEDGLPEKGVKPGGFLPPEHMPLEPPQPAGPGEVLQLRLRPGLPTRDYFPGKYLNLNKDLRQFGLKCFDERRHAVFPAGLNVNGSINSVTFRAFSGSPYLVFSLTEKPQATEFFSNLIGLTTIEYVADVDISDPTKITFRIDRAEVFGHVENHRLVVINLTECEPPDTPPP